MVALAATDEEWIAFSESWMAVLGPKSLDYLHCKEHLTGANLDLKFVAQLSEAIRDHVQGASIIGVEKTAYEAIAQRHKKRVNYREFVFTNIFEKVLLDMDASGINENISFICDDSDHDAQAQYRVWSNMRRKNPAVKMATPSISFADDMAVPPLQAADLIAWLYNQEIRRDHPWKADSPIRGAWPLDTNGQPNVSIEVWTASDLEENEDSIFTSRTFVKSQKYAT